jgi:osmoprotectant transport system permease protein
MQRCDAQWSVTRWPILVAAAVALILLLPGLSASADPLRIGSKRFTESYILGEIIAGTARRAGAPAVEHLPGLGNSAILFSALRNGDIDLYPDYTGTVALELLGLPQVPPLDVINRELARYGLAAGVRLGFENAYALAMSADTAAQGGYRAIGDLRAARGLRAGLSPEFLSRRDGWPALRALYGLGHWHPRSLEHGLAYEALARNEVDLIDVYTTDPKIARQRLRLLEDDRRFFPAYEALLVYRADLPRRHPASWAALQRLEGTIATEAIRGLNAAVELDGRSFGAVAGEWLQSTPVPASQGRQSLGERLLGPDLARLTGQHLFLVLASLLLSVSVGIPLGIWAQRQPRAGRWILPAAGVLQTVPSLALLAFLIAALGQIGALPAVLALFLYALLPVVRSTEAALSGVGKGLRDAGQALGLNAWKCLWLIEFPLALPVVMAGIKTAAVINVGTATIAAFVGAGGYGERIVAGLAVNDSGLMLAGAIPAALLAVLLELAFFLLDAWWMRQRRGTCRSAT